ncbi:response regulator [Methanocalculus taiwanensis]|uniref:Response regulator n=2 Tax=Methanocalculus taiwanensis TaxID=106207 RepID=A0ABD4TL21_9EURY|nr:response regulator [Methanocalculus taiwanensis]
MLLAITVSKGEFDMTDNSVWIVEDESIVAMDLKSRLQSRGYDVLGISGSGEDAVEKIRQHKPDIVLMDIVLKGEMDGITAAGIVREELRIPVVYLTAYADTQTLDRAKQTEPYGYIIKPFKESDVISTLEVALYKASMERKLRESERWIQTMIRSTGEGIIATDTKGLVKFMNPVAENLTGYDEKAVIGKPASEIFSLTMEGPGTSPLDPVNRALANEGSLSSDEDERIVLIAKDGTKRYIGYIAAPIKDDRKQLMGVVLAFRDLTERIRIEEMVKRVVPGIRATPFRDLLKEEMDRLGHSS